MTTRKKEALNALRPFIDIPQKEEISFEEKFQNETLRPIIKFQHDLIMAYVKLQPNFLSILARVATKEEYIREIKPFVHSQTNFKNQLIGIVVGLFTEEEFAIYSEASADLNKRNIQMIIQRIGDTLFPLKNN